MPSLTFRCAWARAGFGIARAYGIPEVDLFAFSAKDLQQWERYWPHLEAYLHCGTARLPAGQCWPYDS